MSKSPYDQGFVDGASASIQKTLNEIEAITGGDRLNAEGQNREKLRAAIEEALTDIAKTWYKKGFNRGHKESFRNFSEQDQFPTEISTTVSRSLIPNSRQRIRLKSSLKEDFIEEVEENL